jgi:hypothetical protein
MKLRKYTGKLYCFSPPVMLVTFLAEFGLALYVIWQYKLNTLGRLVVTMLTALGVFQLAEYMVCGGLGLNTAAWSRLGYASITLLPAIGIHIVSTLAGKKSKPLLIAAYGTVALFALYFVMVPGVIDIRECRPNYAIFNMDHVEVKLYAFQYYGWLLAGMYLAWRWARESKKRAGSLYAMVAGYLVFLIPTTTMNLLDPATISGIPSIMCGFAVLFAAILVGYIMPAAGRPKYSDYWLPWKAKHS